MNKRELIKALFKNPTIKALYESGHFDASDINRAILMEAEEGSDPTAELQNQLKMMKAELAELEKKIGALKVAQNFKAAKELAPVRNKLNKSIEALEGQIKNHMNLAQAAIETPSKKDDSIAAKASSNLADRLSALQKSVPKPDSSNLEADVANLSTDTKTVVAQTSQELEQVKAAQQGAEKKKQDMRQWIKNNDLKDLFNQMYDLEAKNRETLKNARSWDEVKDSLSFLSPPAEGQGIKEWKEQSLSAMKKAFSKANNDMIGIVENDGFTDEQKKQRVSDTINNFISDSSKKEPTSTDSVSSEPALPAGKGWDRAKVSIRQRINNKGLTIEQIETSLKSVDAFKELFGLKSGVEEKMAQAQKLFDDDWIAREIKRLAEKAAKAQTEDAKKAAKEESENAAATVMSFYEFLQAKSQQDQQFQIPQGFEFPTGPTPASKEEFEQQFIAPLEAEAPTPTTPQEQDYIYIADQVIAQAPNLLSEEDLAVKGMKEFIGWYVASRSTGKLNEAPGEGASAGMENIDLKNKQRLLKYKGSGRIEILKHITKNQERWNGIFNRLEDLIKSGKISIDGAPAPDPTREPETREDRLLAVQQQQAEALKQKADPKADEDLSVLEQEEMDSAWKEQLDTFFGKNPKKPSFMRRLLLRDQAAMLYSMIATLDKIILGKRKPKDVGQQASLSDQYDEKPEKPAEQSVQQSSQRQAEPTQASSGNLPEHLINEIFGMFSDKKEKNEQVQLSKESTRNMRQDLEAMVGLLRSLKQDIRGYSQYATRTSIDPRFDGSTLKKAMDAKLVVVQERIAMLTKQIETSVIEQDKQVAADAAAVGKELEEVVNLMSEADESDRRMKIKKVREVYDEMRRLYIDGLMTSLDANDVQNSKRGAKQIKEYVMEQRDFLGFFPSNVVSGGTVMTLGDAYESMSAIIGKFIETIRDVVTITKTQKVSKESLEQAAGDLVSIAENIESMFKVPSKIGEDFVKKYKQASASNSANQSITNEKPAAEDDTFGLVKKWFSNNASAVMDKISEKLLKSLANGFKGKAVNEELLDDIAKSMEWYSSLSNDQKNALEVYSKNILNSIRLQSLEENLKTELVDGLESAGLDKKYAKRVYPAFIGLPVNDKDIITKLMEENMESVVKYIYTFLSLYGDFGQETAEAMIDSESDPSSSEAGVTAAPTGEEPEAATIDDEEDEAVEPPTMTPVESNEALGKYIENNKALKKIDSRTKTMFASFIDDLLKNLFNKNASNLKESFIGNVKGKLRTFYSNMDKVIDQIEKQSGMPTESLKDPLKETLGYYYENLLKVMNTKDLTKLIVDFIKSEKIFTLLLKKDQLDDAFESLVTILGMKDEGTLNRKSGDKEPLPQEYLDKVANKAYPDDMSSAPFAPLLQKILKGDLGLEAMNYFGDRIKNTFTLTPKPSSFEPKDTDKLDSYLFDPISQISILSGFRSQYGKYISLYLANIYEQIKNPTALGNFTPEDFEIGYPSTPSADLNEDEFLESYENLYKYFKIHFKNDMNKVPLKKFVPYVMYAIKKTKQQLERIKDNEDKRTLLTAFQEPEDNPILKLSNKQVYMLSVRIKEQYTSSKKSDSMEEALKPIIEKMLKEHYNH